MEWHKLQEAQTYAQENGLFFMETSAKTAINVNNIFYEIGKFFSHVHESMEPMFVAYQRAIEITFITYN